MSDLIFLKNLNNYLYLEFFEDKLFLRNKTDAATRLQHFKIGEQLAIYTGQYGLRHCGEWVGGL